MRADAPSSQTDRNTRTGAGWRLVVTSATDAATAEHQGSLFALANGVLGVRGGLEEQAGRSGSAFLSAVYDRTPITYHERFTGFAAASDTRVPVADGAQLEVALDGGEALSEIAEFEQVLDLADGLSRRRTVWRTGRGARVEVVAERIVPISGDALLALRFQITAIDYAGPVTLRSLLVGGRKSVAQGDDPRLGAGHGARMITLSRAAETLDASLTQRTGATDMSVACAQTHRITAGEAEIEPIFDQPETCGVKLTTHLAPGQSLCVEKFVAYAFAAGGETEALAAQAQALAQQYAKAGFTTAQADQARAWARFWDEAAIDVAGQPKLETALRYSLYQLRQNAPADGLTGVAAKGLTGEGYEGHCFWDAEVFALPVLAVTAPALARSQLMFRAATLDQARAHARELNHPMGALFPWRTIGGNEASAYFPSGSAQYHINADVAFAVRLYDRASGDDDFLLNHGAALVFETARIWMDLGAFNPRRGGAFCIPGVTGPDEYTALIDNDHYTNRMAQAHLDYACELAERVVAMAPDAGQALLDRLSIDAAELAAWRRAAMAMALPVDPILGVHPQDDTFLDKPLWDFEGSRDQHPLLLHYHPMSLYRHQVCKQASVVLAHAFCPGDDLDQVQRDFDYYEAVTVHDSTLSASSHAIIAAEIGEMDKAGRYLTETAFVDLDDLHGNTDHGLHLAAAGGSWMALVWGWGGFRPQGEVPRFRPVRSGAAMDYTFRLVWRGRRLSVTVDSSGVTYRLISGEPLTIEHDGQRLDLTPGAPVLVADPAPRSPGRAMLVRREPTRRFEAAVIDLDGVLTDTAHAHYLAWKQLADEVGAPFDPAANEALKGVDRMGSLDLILKRAPRTFSAEERQALADRKNAHYRTLIEHFGPQDLFPGAREALEAGRRAGLKLALASASRNARFLIERLGVADLFDHVVDAAQVVRGKPDPETYLRAAEALGVAPDACIGLEDAQAGVAGLIAAGMYTVGIGDPATLNLADAVVGRIDALRWDRIQKL